MLQLLLIIFQNIRCEIVSVQFGCVNTDCTKLCKLGVADCLNFKCEFGYFQFTDTKNSNNLLCLPCPYKFITDDLSLYCQDCYQNPYSWQYNRTCTYYYQIEDGDPTKGAYLQKEMNNLELYYIAAATTQMPKFSNRDTDITLEAYQCQGCKSFCNDVDDATCHIIDKDYVNKGIRCDSTYFFDGTMCSFCLEGCDTCTTSTDCQVCKEGYAFDDYNNNCIKCFDGCKSCYAWETVTYCQQCTSQSIGNYQVPSLDQSKCVSCHDTCARCEFVDYEYNYYPTREQDWNDQGTLRCRQCLYPDTTLNPDGVSCDWCQITNCHVCYYQIDATTTTLDIDFTPDPSVTTEQSCFQCKSGFVLSADKKTCTAFTPNTDNCVSKDSSGNCLMCKDNYILNKAQTPNACQSIKCEKKILNCLDCYAYLNSAEPYVDDSGAIKYSIKPQFQCIKCKDGYYPNLQSGTCTACQNNCQTCWEYTLSYNITGYLQLQIIPKPSDVQVWLYESLENPLCTQCKEGFNIYGNTCLGCTGNCFTKDPSGSAASTLPACVFTDKQAFCSECLDPTKQRSLNDDNSECWDCPNYCLACRSRNSEEMQVNPSFNPSSTLLQKYGRICYSYLETEAGVFMDSQLGVPVKCLSLPTNAKCYNKESITVSISCDDVVSDTNSYQIKKFFPKQDNQGSIKFNKDDNYQSYVKLNSNAVRELDFIVNLIHAPCTFSKPTVLTLNFLDNVFTLQKVNLIIQAESTIQLVMQGALDIYGANTVTLRNIQGSYYSTQKPKDKTFGIKLISSSISQLILENVIFSREYHKESTSQLVIKVDNPNLIQFNNVKFQNLDNVDKIIETNFTIPVNEYQVILQNIIFTDPYQQDNILFPFYGNAIKQSIKIDNLQITQGYFNNSQLIYSIGQTSYLDYDIQNIKLLFVEFLNSTFIYSNNFRQGKFQYFDVVQCRLNYSKIIQVNVINIIKYYSNLNIMLTNSIQILNVDQVTENLLTKAYIQSYNLNAIRFIQNKCSTINCLIKIFTPLNEMNIVTSLTIIGLELNSIITDNIPYEQVQVVQSALCYFTSLDKIILENIYVDQTRAITVFYFSDLTSLSITKISYDWTLPINITNPNTKTQIRNPKNNLIPSTIECAQRKINYRSYSYYLIFVNKFKQNVQISYLKVQRQLSIDASIIYIESYDVQEFNTTTKIPEAVNLYNIQFYNNSLVSLTNGLPLSLIQIKSTQLQNVTINEAKFMSNHLQVLIKKQTATIGTLFNIGSPISWIFMTKMSIDSNRICNSESGLMSIQTQNLMFSSNNITNTNIFDRNWLNLLEEHQLVNDVQFENFFEIRSIGAILNVISAMASFASDKYINSFGVQAGIYIQTDKVGQLSFSSCQFQDMKSSLELKYSSNGGALYVDSSLSQLSLSMNNIIMTNCMSRIKGGCIFINPSNQQHSISISDSSFTKCMAIEHSFMSVEFSDSIIPPQVKLVGIVIQNNNYDWFLSNLPQIQSSDLSYFTSTASVYYQSGGGLLLQDVSFNSHKLSSIIQVERMLRIQIDGLNIQDSKIFLNSIMSISLLESPSSQFILADSKIMNINEIDVVSEQQSCDSLMKSQQIYITITQNCEQIISNQEIADEIDAIDEIYELYNDQVQSDYNTLTDNKYLITYLTYPKFNQSVNLIELFRDTNFNLITCLQNSIYYISQTISTNIYTSLFQIAKTLTGQKISMQLLTITNNQCYKCIGGLGQFRNVQANLLTTPTIEILDFSCTNNIIGYYGCLSFTNENQLDEISINQEIVNQPISSATSNKRLLEQTSITSQLQVVQIRQSKFKENYAKVGGGLNIIGTTVLILNTQFTDNVASLIGGAIFFVNSTNNDLYLSTNVFSGNTAQVGGGLYLQDYTLANTTSLGVVFELNTADEGGSNIQELTHRLSIQLSNQPFKVQTYMNYSGDSNGDGVIDNSSVIIKDNITDSLSKVGSFEYLSYYLEMPSGQPINSYKYFYEYTQEQIPFEWIFRLINLNRQGDPVANGQQEDSCDIEGRIQFEYSYNDKKAYTNNFTRPNKVYYDVSKKAYDMDELVIIFDPYFLRDYYLELRFICSAVKIPIYNTKPPYEILAFNHNYQLYARVRTFPCQKGEIYDANQCKACLSSDNTYNIIKNANICKQIDRLAMNSVSPTGYNLKKGYWRPNYDNDNYESCYNLKDSCLGGWVPGNPSCYTGHLGALCESCDIYAQYNEERWANSAPYICGKCASTRQLNIVIIVAMTIVTLVSVISSVKGTYEDLQLQIVEDIINKMGFRLKSDSSNLATIIKTLTNYFQIIQIISTFQLELPSAVSDTAKTAGNPTGSMASNLDCLLVELTDIEVVYFKMIWALIMPTMYLTIFFVGYMVIILFQLTKFTVSIIYTAFIYLFLYMHPTLVSGFIQLASSRTVSGLPWLKSDVGYRYDTQQQDIWMARFIGPMLLLWVLVLPCLFMFLVWTKRKELDMKSTKMRLGYFYKEYSRDSYLWEFVKIFQKESMVIAYVYYDEFVVVKGLLIVLILFLYGWYQVSVTPYSSLKLNITDRYSTVICGASLCFGVLMYGSLKGGLYYLVYIILAIILVINIWFILMCIFQIFEGYLVKLSDVLDKVRDIINKKYPDLRDKGPRMRRLLRNQGKFRVKVKYLWGLLKENVLQAEKIKKKHKDLFFEDAFEIICEISREKKDKIQNSPSPVLILSQMDEERQDILKQ